MKQIQFAAFGPPSHVARLMDVADLSDPSAWEVVVDVEAFPINVSDLATLSGHYGTLPQLPSTIGMEAVGLVSQCGTSVRDLAPGDRVILLANKNWSERRKVPLATVHKVDRNADPLQMAMLKVNPVTAYLLLKDYQTLMEGDWIIQNAPLSSVGQCVMQIAKNMGVRMVNVVRRLETTAKVLAMGGSVVVEDGPDLAKRVAELIGHDPIRLALDAVAGPGVNRLAECLVEGAPIINYGMLSTESCVLSAEQTIFRNISLRGFWLSKLLSRMPQSKRVELLDTLAGMITSGKLQMEVDSVFPIEQIQAALQRAEQAGRNGKVLVTTQYYKAQ
ncbi:MAG: zinc-dependent alcohol dehydrogenase family protein [Pirellulaceae bacterium]|nr:zinc-dependent alcohol dehydrogenase family protein [Pirellulaceae bacterium]